MKPIVSENIEAYAREHTEPRSTLFDTIADVTEASTTAPQMQVGPLVGRLLTLLTKLVGADLAVEVGTFTGGSALCIAEGLRSGGKLITCDREPIYTAIAERFWRQSPWGDRIELRMGVALDTLKCIDGPIDFAFLDADKAGYIAYWDDLVPKLRPGGVIVADNVLWSGDVLDPHDEDSRALDAFNRHVLADGRMENVMLTVRDGLTVARKKLSS